MKKITLSLASLLFAFSGFSQAVEDSIRMGASYANEMYLKLEDGTRTTHPANSWHIGFATSAYSVAVVSNPGLPSPGMGQAGISISVYPNGDASAFASVDTTGFYTWPKLYNDSLDYEVGAFNQSTNGTQFDYGWGQYNSINHQITGDSLYIVKIGSDCYKFKIVSKAAGKYTFNYALISDNTEGTQVEINGSTDYATKNFVFFNFADGQVKDLELAGWDLWATKHYDWYGTTPNQVVTGILVNPKWDVATVNVGSGNQASHNDYSSADFVNKKNNIGSTYKSLNMQTFAWEVTDSKVYYLQNAAGDVWKLYPTSFSGSSTGETKFMKEHIAYAGVENVATQFVDVYPNPVENTATVVFEGKGATEIIVRNQMGQVVVAQSLASTSGITQHQLDLSNLTNGMYFVQINQNGSSIVKNIVKK